ncbi:MAG: diaminopimelate epimerase [Chitinophagales bacterium]
MNIKFSKYHGTGNDFILIDNRTKKLFAHQHDLFAFLCDRRFGIGADGLMLIEPHETLDFEMVYVNADGKESSMCGNGGRCIVAFARKIGLLNKSNCRFMAIDGEHSATINEENIVKLGMNDVLQVEKYKNDFILDTGSPHYICFLEHLNGFDITKNGRNIRNSETFKKEGINVNFVVEKAKNCIEVATYERGVEAETYSCGTGVVAASIATAMKQTQAGFVEIEVQTKGGKLGVSFQRNKNSFIDVCLIGKATHVFDGEITIE